MNLEGLVLYAVRNGEGKWFRRKGYGGYGDTWTDDFKKARVYNRIGPARGTVSFFANHYPTYPTPDLVALKIGSVEVIDEQKRVNEQKQKKELAKKKQQERQRGRELELAKQRYDSAKSDLDKLQS